MLSKYLRCLLIKIAPFRALWTAYARFCAILYEIFRNNPYWAEFLRMAQNLLNSRIETPRGKGIRKDLTTFRRGQTIGGKNEFAT